MPIKLVATAPWLRPVYGLTKRFLRTPEKGAETSIHLASSPQIEGVTGKYFVDKKEVRSSPETYNEDLARKLWTLSERLTAL